MSRVARPASAFSLAPQTKLQRERAAFSDRVFRRAREAVKVREAGCCARCGELGDQACHRTNRGKGGSNADPTVTHALSRLVWLNGPCHRWIGDNPREAEAEGYLVRRGVIAADRVPLNYRGRWVLLTDDGQITEVIQ